MRIQAIFIELEKNHKDTSEIINKIQNTGFLNSKKIQVQNYDGVYNHIFTGDL